MNNVTTLDQFHEGVLGHFSSCSRYKSCHKANLNGLNYNTDRIKANGVSWQSWRGDAVSLRATEMAIYPTEECSDETQETIRGPESTESMFKHLFVAYLINFLKGPYILVVGGHWPTDDSHAEV